MGVRIDAARHDIAAAGVDDRCAGGRVDSGADRQDRFSVNQDIRAPRMIVVYDGTAADDETGHGNSEQAFERWYARFATLAFPVARWSLKSRATARVVPASMTWPKS